jgi:ferredoxin like protein
MSKVNVDVKLGVDKFFVDEGEAHILLQDNPDKTELKKLVNACPANLYKILDDGSVQFDHAGCLECGTCRVLCGQTILKKWQFPLGTMGVEYRYG